MDQGGEGKGRGVEPLKRMTGHSGLLKRKEDDAKGGKVKRYPRLSFLFSTTSKDAGGRR